MDFLSKIDIDFILSDTYLLSGTLVFIFSSLLFLIGLINYTRARRKETSFYIPPSGEGEEANLEYPEPAGEASEPAPAPTASESEGDLAEPTAPEARPEPVGGAASGNEIEHRLEDLETRINQLEKRVPGTTAQSELQQTPVDPEDFTKKLLKLAEHVIVLENQMAKIKNGAGETPPQETAATPSSPAPELKKDKPNDEEPPPPKPDKPPVMPL